MTSPYVSELEYAKARIAELDAEVARLTEREDAWHKRDALWHKLNGRIAELEAEQAEAYNDGFTAGYNEAYERYGTSSGRHELLKSKTARIAELEAVVKRGLFLGAAEKRIAELEAALTSAAQVIDAMVIQFRNRDQQPPEPQLIQAGKIVLAAIDAAIRARPTP